MIYLDNAATTPVLPAVRAAMSAVLEAEYGNPSSLHAMGRSARKAVEAARDQVAHLFGCDAGEVVFTSGGTEADHAALCGAWLAGREHGRTHIVTSAIEHHAVLDTCAFLAALGAEVSFVSPDKHGLIQVDDVLAAMRPDTALVSVMAVNNELGSIQPVSELASAVKRLDADVVVHSDCVQAVGVLADKVATMQVDLAVISAHKLHGPKGVGALFVRGGTAWRPVLHGGNQERKRRAGTENVAGIVGFGAAVERFQAERDTWLAHVEALRQEFLRIVLADGLCEVNSPLQASSPAILNVRFPGVRADRLLMRLDLAGVAASAGSACTAGSLEPSHVLLACGHSAEAVAESVRFSFSDQIALDDVRAAGEIVGREVQWLRRTTMHT